MKKKKVLFVCVHNSAHSQMAEAFLNSIDGERFSAESAGLEPGRLNPTVVRVMQDVGIDITQNETNSVREFLEEGRSYDYVITVCDESSASECPVFPGDSNRLHWSFEDPSGFSGTSEEIQEKIKTVRDSIRSKVEEFIDSV